MRRTGAHRRSARSRATAAASQPWKPAAAAWSCLKPRVVQNRGGRVRDHPAGSSPGGDHLNTLLVSGRTSSRLSARLDGPSPMPGSGCAPRSITVVMVRGPRKSAASCQAGQLPSLSHDAPLARTIHSKRAQPSVTPDCGVGRPAPGPCASEAMSCASPSFTSAGGSRA